MRFKSRLFRLPGPGGWVFAPVPEGYAPPVTHGWGRTPVHATVDGRTWETSVWRDKRHGTVPAVPKNIRSGKDDGDLVEVELQPREATVSTPATTPPARRKPIRRTG